MSFPRPPHCGAHWVDYVARHACSIPGGTAIRYEGTTITWMALHERVQQLASAFHARGVSKGDRVAVLMTNRPEFIETTLAANALGAIAVPVNFRLSPDEAAYILQDSGSVLLVADIETVSLATAATHGNSIPVILAGLDPDAQRSRLEAYSTVLAEDSAPAPEIVIDERDVALIMYTSGTTGRPKGAMLTHLNLLMQSITIIRTFGVRDDDTVWLLNVPLFHIAGIGSMPPLLMVGATTVIMPTGAFDARSTLDVVEREGVTSLFLVPAQWQVLCADPDTMRRTRAVRTISWGAAPATVSLLETMASTFPHADIISVFGQTEMSPATTTLSGKHAVRKIGSVGRPIPTISARVVDESMNDVPTGEVGEIVYRGPTLMTGYWRDPQSTVEAFAGGWFHSGDLVRADDEGFIYVVDRKKDMIISGGENIYCAEVENALAAHPAVADVAVIGARHDRWGETPVAIVVPTDADAPPALTDLVEFTRDRLASYKKPTQLVLLDALPRNAAGKVLKHELRARYGGEPVSGRPGAR